MDDDRSGVLLIRVWLERGTGEFRARMTTTGPGSGGDSTVAVASSSADLAEALRTWLDDFVSSGVRH